MAWELLPGVDTGQRDGIPIETFSFETFALNLSCSTGLSFHCLKSELALPCALLKESRGGS